MEKRTVYQLGSSYGKYNIEMVEPGQSGIVRNVEYGLPKKAADSALSSIAGAYETGRQDALVGMRVTLRSTLCIDQQIDNVQSSIAFPPGTRLEVTSKEIGPWGTIVHKTITYKVYWYDLIRSVYNDEPRKRLYVGLKDGKREVFRSAEQPTKETHGEQYEAVIGPFRTLRGAVYCKQFGGNNPHIQGVQDAERIGKEHADKWDGKTFVGL